MCTDGQQGLRCMKTSKFEEAVVSSIASVPWTFRMLRNGGIRARGLRRPLCGWGSLGPPAVSKRTPQLVRRIRQINPLQPGPLATATSNWYAVTVKKSFCSIRGSKNFFNPGASRINLPGANSAGTNERGSSVIPKMLIETSVTHLSVLARVIREVPAVFHMHPRDTQW